MLVAWVAHGGVGGAGYKQVPATGAGRLLFFPAPVFLWPAPRGDILVIESIRSNLCGLP